MDKIILDIKSPEWWFTIGVAGCLVSLLAGYVKDWISLGLSHLSRRVRHRRRRRLRKLALQLYAFEKIHVLLPAYGVKLLISMVVFFVSLFGGTLMMLGENLAIEHPEFNPLPHVHLFGDYARSFGPRFMTIADFILVGMGISIGFRLPIQMTIFGKGYIRLQRIASRQSKRQA